VSLVRFKTGLEEKPMVESMTVFNSNEVDTKKQPMFFGQPLGIQRYDSYKYPIFDKLTTQQLGYFWRPEEVSLQKDRGDYQSLRPEQKHIFTSNLKYQIMLDSVQGRGPGMAFAPYCSLPELEACMKVWEFMEMIHSRSYTYIIKNVYSDPSEVFDTILKEDRIMERAVTVTQAYNDFINSAHQYDNSSEWMHALEQVPTHKRQGMNSNANYTEQLQTLIFLKAFAFTCHLLAVLHLANSNLWKEVQKSSH
jgi:ribonucleotide reductase beta subunit family protein with ferritin-like domain